MSRNCKYRGRVNHNHDILCEEKPAIFNKRKATTIKQNNQNPRNLLSKLGLLPFPELPILILHHFLTLSRIGYSVG